MFLQAPGRALGLYPKMGFGFTLPTAADCPLGTTSPAWSLDSALLHIPERELMINTHEVSYSQTVILNIDRRTGVTDPFLSVVLSQVPASQWSASSAPSTNVQMPPGAYCTSHGDLQFYSDSFLFPDRYKHSSLFTGCCLSRLLSSLLFFPA